MAELRRLLVDPARLDRLADGERQLQLLPDESHYLRRVLRLRSGDAVAVVDGTGGCWTACLLGSDQLFSGDIESLFACKFMSYAPNMIHVQSGIENLSFLKKFALASC